MLRGAPDDRRLIEQAQRGDTRAFETLYRQHVNTVYGVALRLTLDRRQAEDLTQEAFVHMWRQLDGFRFESSFATWAYRVTSNLVISAIRRERRFKVAAAPAEEQGEEMTAAQSLDTERHLARLPERARMVLILHDLVGMSHAEIGAQLNIAEGTSKAQLHRARALFREYAGLE